MPSFPSLRISSSPPPASSSTTPQILARVQSWGVWLTLGRLGDTARRWAELRWTGPSGLRRARSAGGAGVWRPAGGCAALAVVASASRCPLSVLERVNPVDSTFNTRRGSHSILAYIRRASALPPPPPSASPHAEWGRALHSSSASASQDPLSSHSRR